MPVEQTVQLFEHLAQRGCRNCRDFSKLQLQRNLRPQRVLLDQAWRATLPKHLMNFANMDHTAP